GPVPRCVDAPDDDRAECDLVAVRERVVRVLGSGSAVDGDRYIVLQREPPVPGDVIGVGVRLENAPDANPVLLGGREVGLDRVRGVDQKGLARLLVADEIGGTAEVLVDELAEQHSAVTLAALLAVFPKVTSGPKRWADRPMADAGMSGYNF